MIEMKPPIAWFDWRFFIACKRDGYLQFTWWRIKSIFSCIFLYLLGIIWELNQSRVQQASAKNTEIVENCRLWIGILICSRFDFLWRADLLLFCSVEVWKDRRISCCYFDVWFSQSIYESEYLRIRGKKKTILRRI